MLIQPVMAEGLMVSSSNSSFADQAMQHKSTALHQQHHNHQMHTSQTSLEHNHDCCESGVHQCKMFNCDSNLCNHLHLSQVLTPLTIELTSIVFSHFSATPFNSNLISRTVSPETPPPLA